MKLQLFQNVTLGSPCPFTRDPITGSHPNAEMQEIAGRYVVVCRHCNAELANQPTLPLLEEPYEPDPRVRLAEGSDVR